MEKTKTKGKERNVISEWERNSNHRKRKQCKNNVENGKNCCELTQNY